MFFCFIFFERSTMLSLNGYLGQVSSAWDDYDGDALARLLSFEDPHSMSPRLRAEEDPSREVERVLEEPIDDIVSDHLRACYQYANADFVAAYEHQVTLGKEISFLQFCV